MGRLVTVLRSALAALALVGALNACDPPATQPKAAASAPSLPH